MYSELVALSFSILASFTIVVYCVLAPSGLCAPGGRLALIKEDKSVIAVLRSHLFLNVACICVHKLTLVLHILERVADL